MISNFDKLHPKIQAIVIYYIGPKEAVAFVDRTIPALGDQSIVEVAGESDEAASVIEDFFSRRSAWTGQPYGYIPTPPLPRIIRAEASIELRPLFDEIDRLVASWKESRPDAYLEMAKYWPVTSLRSSWLDALGALNRCARSGRLPRQDAMRIRHIQDQAVSLLKLSQPPLWGRPKKSLLS